jgi:hypothetical protein
MGKDDGKKNDKTDPFNKDNIINPTSIDELPEELRQKLQAKLDADTKAFLKSCDKSRHDKVTHFCKLDFGDASTASSSDSRKAKAGEEVHVDPYPTHANYATMLLDQKKTITDSLTSTIQHSHKILADRLDKLEGRTTDSDQSGDLQPEFGMPRDFNKQTNDKGMASTSKSQGSVRLNTDHRASRTSTEDTIIPNPPKSPSPLPTFDLPPNAASADFLEAMNRFRDWVKSYHRDSSCAHI